MMLGIELSITRRNIGQTRVKWGQKVALFSLRCALDWLGASGTWGCIDCSKFFQSDASQQRHRRQEHSATRIPTFNGDLGSSNHGDYLIIRRPNDGMAVQQRVGGSRHGRWQVSGFRGREEAGIERVVRGVLTDVATAG